MSSKNFASLQKLPVAELKKMCRDASMNVSGTKQDLLMRLCGVPDDKNRMSVKEVNKWLEKQGVDNVKKVSKCLRAGIRMGHVDISGENPLDNVVISDTCLLCDHKLKPTIRDLLYQQDYAGHDYECGENAAVKCPNEDCELEGVYVTGICCGSVAIDSGKGHHHCTICPDFGRCIWDYREKHCRECGDHFYSCGGHFKCHCKGEEEEDIDEDGFEAAMLSYF